MTPQELKESILWNAIQGKITEQNPHETVNDVIESTQITSFTEEETYFEIPNNWKWVHIGDIFDLVNGKAFKPSDWSDKGIPIVRIQNLNDPSAPYNYCSASCEDKYYLHGGELLFSWSGTPGTSFGAFIWNGGEAVLNQHIFIAHPKIKADKFYLMYALNAELKIFVEKAHGGAGLKHITRKEFDACFLPIPPLAEQKRIVAKIEELLPLIDRYEKAWSRLEEFNNQFPEDLQKSILQMAIQGKLVEQRPEEGTGEELYQLIQEEKQKLIKEGKIKKEKPLPEITEEDKPFSIPESWKWVRLASATSMLSGYAFKSENFKDQGKYRLLRGINLGVQSIRWDDTVYIDAESEHLNDYKIQVDDVLLGMDRPWISGGTRVAVFSDDINAYLVQRVLRLRSNGCLTSSFTALILRSSLFLNALRDETTGISVPHISQNQVGDIIIPLPPIAEQKRIVFAIESLLPLCNRLK